jgi:hypothetical protein
MKNNMITVKNLSLKRLTQASMSLTAALLATSVARAQTAPAAPMPLWIAPAAPATAAAEPGFVPMEPTGGFLLSGAPSPIQYHNVAILVRCKSEFSVNGIRSPLQRSCDPATTVQIPINQPAQLPEGEYMLAFENTVYPGLISIKAGGQREVKLVQLAIPNVGKDARITVARDLSRLEEQRKIYFSEFTMAQPLFPLTIPDGYDKDLYPRMGDADKPILSDARYKVCDSKKLPPLSPKAKRLCRLWRMQNPMALSEFFNFGEDGAFEQYLFIRPRGSVNSSGAVDVTSKKRGRLLVTPNNYVAGQFVNVLPGSYRIDYRGKNGVWKKEQFVVGYQPTYNQYTPYGSIWNMSLVPLDPNAASETAMGPVLDGAAFGMKFRTVSLDEAVDAINSSTDTDDAAEETSPDSKTCRDNGVIYKTELRSYCVNDPNKTPVEGCDQAQTSFCELIPVVK